MWAVGVEGLALVESTALTSWGYSLLDIGAKYAFAYFLLSWVASNESAVEETARPNAVGATPPADD